MPGQNKLMSGQMPAGVPGSAWLRLCKASHYKPKVMLHLDFKVNSRLNILSKPFLWNACMELLTDFLPTVLTKDLYKRSFLYMGNNV